MTAGIIEGEGARKTETEKEAEATGRRAQTGGGPAGETPPVDGLEGVVATATRLSRVDGAAGRLTLAGYAVEEIAPRASFEEMVHLLWHDRLPDAGELAALSRRLAVHREVPAPVLALLRAAAEKGAASMDALRMGVAALDSGGSGELEAGPGADPAGAADPERGRRVAAARRDAERLVAAVPSLVAAYHRLRQGLEPLPAPRGDGPGSQPPGLVACYLEQLTGEAPSADRVRALTTYLNTVSDHGLNASTFAARVIVSTGSDLVSAITGAVGALKGPLHGGAPGPALDTVLAIGRPERAEEVLRGKLARGERLMGFGHRVYRVRDPRADVLARAAEELFARGTGDRGLYELARSVERTALRLLRAHKPGRRLETNVEFYTALLLTGLDLPPELFTPTFAVGRSAGWTAHALEQASDGRLMRPAAQYRGAQGRRWVDLEAR